METNVGTIEEKNNRISDTAGTWLGWIGIIASVIGFFWAPLWMGIAGIISGGIGLFSSKKWLNGIAFVAGVVALIVGIV